MSKIYTDVEKAKKKILSEVNKQVKNLQEKEKCLWLDCYEKSISAHSNSKYTLKKIATNNHVYGLDFDSKQSVIRRIGVRKASTFYGFCKKHDNDLFSEIESDELTEISPKQAFLFFARAIFLEYSKKKKVFLKLQKIVRKYDDMKIAFERDVLISHMAGLEHFIEVDAKFYKKNVENIYNDFNNKVISYQYKIINRRIDVSLSTLIQPYISSTKLKSNSIHPCFSLNIVPFDNHGVVVLSWLSDHDKDMNDILIKYNEKYNEVINDLCFRYSENFFLSENFYQSNEVAIKNYLNKFLFYYNEGGILSLADDLSEILYDFE